ncbi:T-cell immunomodulatory protein precursor, putative [Entamoeba invadens IP1]|uniref:T-cell immunomodulatory protein precursor, putative n=1 Tax=Entamoeba invadens IP1 TaxID=370355 RepID=UPI0002C3D6C3|nr:T-cell immunomodulatory protein precursor, putative [Entamoeba invadens IP1]ELP85138.1 T-cell immunomodulatory protein precursor, putative [Entamoeba invadens IP1]|eukprot:XP_004184484.1 T-cell immunomodulatory protein precursor, putative [Entamoeba invadens IP1]
MKLFLLVLICTLTTFASVWTPFKKKNSCSKGVDFCEEAKWSFEGEIVAFADYDNDQEIEVFVVKGGKMIDVVKHNSDSEERFSNNKTLLAMQDTVVSVTPGDFMYLGQTDLLVQTKSVDGLIKVHLCPNVVSTPITCKEVISSQTQVAVYDVNGDNYLDLIGTDVESKGTVVWLGVDSLSKNFEKTTKYNFPTYDSKFPITIADVNGDCRGDIMFVNSQNVEIYLASFENEEIKYVHNSEKDVKLENMNSIFVTDFNRDGNLDLAWTTTKGELKIVPNTQRKICKSFLKSDSSCRSQSQLCEKDDNFKFNTSEVFTFTLNSSLSFKEVDGLTQVAVGDYNNDAYPDFVVIVQDNTAQAKDVFGLLLMNEAGKKISIDGSAENVFRSTSLGATNAVFYDCENQGILNVLFNVESSENSMTTQKVKIISNNEVPDALFVKIAALNGVILKHDTKAYGTSYFGGVFKLALADTSGDNVGISSMQLTQTTHKIIQMPFAHIGLGRISNYIQVVEFGTNMKYTVNHNQWQSIIPNSQLVVIPDPPQKAANWKIELYFLDLTLMFWIAIAMTIALVILGIIMLALFIRDKRKEANSHFLNMK